MTEQHSEGGPSSADRFLDALLDALLERQRQRKAQGGATPLAAPQASQAPGSAPRASAPQRGAGLTDAPAEKSEAHPQALDEGRPARRSLESGATPAAMFVASPPAKPAAAREASCAARLESREPRPSIGMDRLIRRMVIGLVVAIVLINIPVAAHGLSLVRLLPDSASLVIRDGLVLKGGGDRIYMLQSEQLRWISSMDAFEHLGLSWEDVHQVDDAFLERFEMGRPLDILAKCDGSPHIYALRDGEKRWIRDIEVFVAEGYVWDDVSFVSCSYLRALPDGEPIPPDAGTPPQP